MALISEKNDYLRVTKINFNKEYVTSFEYKIFPTSAELSVDGLSAIVTTGAEKASNPDFDDSQIETKMVNSGLLKIELENLSDAEKTNIDNIWTACYNAIKADTFEFSNWTDA